MSTAPAELIDIGANLTDRSFNKDLEEVLGRAADAGVATMIVTGTSAAASEQALALTRRDPQRLRSTAGVHPHHAKDFDADAASVLRQLAGEAAVVAIGETGLDFNRDFSPRRDQERAFEAQLTLACELGMPAFLHQRDAHERFLPILKDYRDRLSAAVVHCFTGTREELWDYLDLDLYVGVTGWICDERRGEHLKASVPDIPAQRLLLETDAPYLLPRTLKPRPKSRRNEPAFLPEVLRAVAAARGEPEQELAAQTSANARRFFGLAAG